LIERRGDGAAKLLTKREMESFRSRISHQDGSSLRGAACASRENDLDIAALLQGAGRC
jgi:hypothetical protein